MGVIQNERPLDRNRCPTSISEETLYIASEDDRESVGSVRLYNPRRRTNRNQRVNRGLENNPTVKADCGKKKSRRYHNVNSLVTLAEEDELNEVTIEDFVGSSKTPFTLLLETENGLEKWEEFVTSTEDVQKSILDGEKPIKKSEEKCRPINPVLRRMVKKRTVPIGMLEYLEQQLVDFFSSMPHDIYISPELSSFERLILHNLSDYHALSSLSFNRENMRLVRVKNSQDKFCQPSILLTQYLQNIYKIS